VKIVEEENYYQNKEHGFCVEEVEEPIPGFQFDVGMHSAAIRIYDKGFSLMGKIMIFKMRFLLHPKIVG
jgi:hypothetical protein